MNALMALLLVLGADEAKTPIQVNLIMNRVVQKELGILPGQVVEIRRATNVEKLAELKKVTSNPRLSLKERTKALHEVNTQLMEDLEKNIEETLLPHQVERLRQISLQVMVQRNQVEAFEKADLQLTSGQKQDLASVKRERDLDLQELIRQHNAETERLLLQEVTKEQRMKWVKAVGPEFKMGPVTQ